MEYYGLSDQRHQQFTGAYAAEFPGWVDSTAGGGGREDGGAEGAGDGGGEYAPRAAVLVDGGDQFGVTAVIFDKYEELVWMGNGGGHVTSYYGPDMQKYTSFQVHESEEVRHFAALEQGILALTQTTLRHQIRRGIPKYTHRSEHMTAMQCLLQVSPHRILMAGHQEEMLDLDLIKMKETVIVRDPEGCAVMRSSGGSLVACGSVSGSVALRDTRTPGRAVLQFQAHSACLSDLDIQGDSLITAGFSYGDGDIAVPEPYVIMWDVRKVQRQSANSVWTVVLPAPPMLLHFVPAVSGRAVGVASSGEVMLFSVNAGEEDKQTVFQVDAQNGPLTVFDISASSQALVFGGQSGKLNLYSPQHNTEPIFNSFSRETEFAAPLPNIPFVSLSDETFQLSSIPIPLLSTGQKLFSDWPPEFTKKAYRRPKPIDPEVLKTMKMQGPIGYAPNPHTSRRNEMPYIEDSISSTDSPKHGINPAMTQPIPKKYHKVEMRYSKHSSESEFEHYNKTGFPGLEATQPNSYCNAMLQVLYYTLPVKATLLDHTCAKEFCLSCELGFLFRMLDTSSGAPCQASNFLRAFRTVPEAAALGLIFSDRQSHPKIDLIALIQSWNRFILHQMHFEILELLKEKIQALRIKPAFKADNLLPNASKLSARLSVASNALHREDPEHTELAEEAVEATEDRDRLNLLMQEGGGDFASRHLGAEGRLFDHFYDKEESPISILFGMRQAQLNRCLKCNKEVERVSLVLACALQYPPAMSKSEQSQAGDFLSLLRASLKSRKTTPAWCEACERFSPTVQNARVVSLPAILAINFGGVTSHEKAYWKKATQKENMDARRSSTTSGSSSKPCRYGLHCARPGCRFRHPDRLGQHQASHTSARSEVQCVLPHRLLIELHPDGEITVDDKWKDTPPTEQEVEGNYRLSACVVSVEDSQNLVAYIRMEDDQWYLFNDVSIVSVSADEVVQFSSWWKTPCVLFYTWPEVDDPTLLGSQTGTEAGGKSESVFDVDVMRYTHLTSPETFTPLGPHEMPTPGTLVGMDAEFVTLNSEEVELTSDGRCSTLRPSHMSVARITCVRGQGQLEGVPFIDDYISTQEQVVDYLTKFSGIKPGDLDANFSSKHLTTLKSTYRKLRSLVDSGVVFVGHGLNNDFRVINLVVPPEQVIDTVQLFHLPHHRMVSLKFLAWHFFGIKIQSVTHDSVEDARTALRLRHKWAELGASGELRAALVKLYRAGDEAGWRVPD